MGTSGGTGTVAGLESGKLSGILTGSELGSSIMGAGDSGVDGPEYDGVLNTGDVSGDSSNLKE